MGETYYNMSETAELLGVSPRAVSNLLKKGRLQGYKAGREYKITESSINAVKNGSGIHGKKEDYRGLLFTAISDYGLKPEIENGLGIVSAVASVPLQKFDRLTGSDNHIDVNLVLTEDEQGKKYHYCIVFPAAWLDNE